MQREDEPPAGAQAARPSTLSEVLRAVQLSEYSETQLTTFVESLSQGVNAPRFRTFLTYILRFVEYNRSKYETLRTEQARLIELANSMRDELTVVSATMQERLPIMAPVSGATAAPTVATQPQIPAAQPLPATWPSAPAATATPSAFQAVPPRLAPQVTGFGQFAAPAAFAPSCQNPDGTTWRRMDQVGNNVIVTFSGDDDMASKRAKLFGSAAKYDIFTGQDMSQFSEWVTQFLSGVNLFQPTEANACKIALHLLKGKAAEMSKNVPEQVSMQNLQELLTTLDRIFNTTGNRIVAVGLFNSFTQREDLSVQDYSIKIEQLFYRAYPGVNPDASVFLMDRFINGYFR